MRDNPQAGADAAFALPDHTVIELHGPDATRFAQAQFMSDVSALPCGHWHWSGWLTPKGRVVAVFAVLKLAQEHLWMLLPDAPPAPLADALRRFVFRSKVTVVVRDDLHAQGVFAAAESASGSALAGDADTTIELDFSAAGGARRAIIGREAAAATSDPDVARWMAFDLAHGLPRLDAAQAGQWTPQQLSLDRLSAFSIKKGCYPGQEIVARTHFLGKAKRGLALVESDQSLSAGAQLRADEVPLGTLVASTGTPDGRHLALAVVPLERAVGALNIEGVAVSEAPLQDGLAR